MGYDSAAWMLQRLKSCCAREGDAAVNYVARVSESTGLRSRARQCPIRPQISWPSAQPDRLPQIHPLHFPNIQSRPRKRTGTGRQPSDRSQCLNAGTEANAPEKLTLAFASKGAKELFDLLEKHKADVEKLMRSVKGFAGYTLVRTGDGGISVTVCQDKAGIDESMQKAKDWVAKNAGSTGVAAPKVSAGSVIAHIK